MKPIYEKWQPLIEAEELPQIIGQSRQEIAAAILENQELDFVRSAEIYQDEFIATQLQSLSEANTAGDHGYSPDNIAIGKNTGVAVGVGPTVMGMVRRAIPQLIAFDICGIQPMNGPTSQLFTFRAMYGKDPLNAEAIEANNPIVGIDPNYSGQFGKNAANAASGFTALSELKASATLADQVINAGETKFYTFTDEKYAGRKIYVRNNGDANITVAGTNDAKAVEADLIDELSKGTLHEVSEAMLTSYAELMESYLDSENNAWNEMSFRIDKSVIEAKSRQLKAQYSIELAQDLRAVHGMSADQELTNILANEIIAEINREVLLWINACAQIGKTGITNTRGGQTGIFNLADPNDTFAARWAGESYKSLIIQIDKEAAEIGRQTGRGNGNIVIASRNVVAALGSTDMLVSPASQGTSMLNTDTSESCFAGILAGKYRVYIDQYAKEDYITVGLKNSELEAGLYFCPYTMLTPLRAADPKSFQPVLGFKTRYAIAQHPMCDSTKYKGFSQITNGMPSPDIFGKNCFYRRFLVKGV